MYAVRTPPAAGGGPQRYQGASTITNRSTHYAILPNPVKGWSTLSI
jgi:hypothetical protein